MHKKLLKTNQQIEYMTHIHIKLKLIQAVCEKSCLVHVPQYVFNHIIGTLPLLDLQSLRAQTISTALCDKDDSKLLGDFLKC